jgi:UDP-glucose 4-epimerase
MKVLVTGAAGFIGSHLCEYLVNLGIEVVGIDNLSRGSVNNLINCSKSRIFKFHHEELSNLEKLIDISINCSIVFHLADESDIQFALQHPQSYFIDNTKGLFTILKCMKINSITKIFFPSSTTVFGRNAVPPISEGYGPLLPESLYGASKVSSEAFLHAWSIAYDVEILIFRFAAIIGGRQDHGVVHDFVKRISINSNILNVLGNGNQKRSFVLVDDCVRILTEYLLHHMQNKFEIVHLANPDTVSIKEVAEIVCSQMNIDPHIIKYEISEFGWVGDSITNQLDIEKLRFKEMLPVLNSRESVIEAASRLNRQYSELDLS